jgi:hypothetical protein
MAEVRQINNDSGPSSESLPAYEPPTVRVMNEAEVLSAFQLTLASTPSVMWWTS